MTNIQNRVCVYVPTVCMGFLYGRRPKLYWKTPLAWKRGKATPMILWKRSCTRLRVEPAGFSIWSKSSFSPNENTGTNHALKTTADVMACFFVRNENLVKITSSYSDGWKPWGRTRVWEPVWWSLSFAAAEGLRLRVVRPEIPELRPPPPPPRDPRPDDSTGNWHWLSHSTPTLQVIERRSRVTETDGSFIYTIWTLTSVLLTSFRPIGVWHQCLKAYTSGQWHCVCVCDTVTYLVVIQIFAHHNFTMSYYTTWTNTQDDITYIQYH